MNNPAIIVIAHNRPASLLRLLNSIANARYDTQNILLYISIDKSEVYAVEEIARNFDWKHGAKEVHVSAEHLGLKKHILQSGDLAQTFGSIIVLEDDLLVSPNFYEFARKGLDFYAVESKIAGISLYNYEVAESCGYPFSALKDQSDVYFMQVASSWGQAWTNAQWKEFKNWLDENGDQQLDLLPTYVKKWGDHSWKKYFINYLVATDSYFVFPHFSFSTNFEDRGTNASTVDLYQVELETSHRDYVFTTFQDSKSIYDAYFEALKITLDRHTTELEAYDYSIDLYGQKPLTDINTKYLLTTRSGSEPDRTFSTQMHPLLNNIIYKVQGKGLQLLLKENVHENAANPAEFYSKSMVQQLRDQAGEFDSFSIVILVLEFDEELLSITLSSMPLYDSRVQVVLSCNESIANQLAQLELVTIHQLKIVASSSSEEHIILADGLSNVENEIVTWCKQGSRLASDAISKVAGVFGNYKQLYWVTGIQTSIQEKNYHSMNTACYRWNQSMLIQYKKRAQELDTEFTFWRRNVLERAQRAQSERIGNVYFALMKEVELTVVCYPFGKSASARRRQEGYRKIEVNLAKPSILKRTVGRVTYFFFRRNIRLLRFFFVELEHLPAVLRYDFKNDTFFTSRY